MPYENERAKHRSIVDITNSSKVNEFIGNMKIITNGFDSYETIDNFIVNEDNLKESENKIKWVFSYDGSKSSINIDIGFPGAEIHVIKVAQTFVDLEKMKRYERTTNPHPMEYEAIFINSTDEIVSPGVNVCGEKSDTPEDFFRETLYNFFNNSYNNFIDNLFLAKNKNITYLETLKYLLKDKKEVNICNPCEVCSYNQQKIPLSKLIDNEGITTCNCVNNPKQLYLTDCLGFHEIYNNTTSNEDVHTQLMSLIEKVMFINLLDNLEINLSENENALEKILKESIFILDGPLALYGYSSIIVEGIIKKLTSDKYKQLKLIGVEKTGHFVEHLKNLNTISEAKQAPIRAGCLFYLNDSYIKKYIKYSNSLTPYGLNQYFGKKFFYKNKLEQLFVINQLFKNNSEREHVFNSRNEDLGVKDKDIFDIAYLLENFSSRRYDNALSFISMAHEATSISNNKFGTRILENFIKSNLNEDLYKMVVA